MTQISQELDLMMTQLSRQGAEIEFDPALHKYVVAGVEYPSVNQVLQDDGIVDTAWFREGSAEKGIRVHWICEQADKDFSGMRLFMDDTLEEYEGYLDAWEDFKEKSGFVVSLIETPLYSKVLGIAGTLDRIGFLNDKLTIIDIKSGTKLKWHGLQLAGYKMLLEHLTFPGEPCIPWMAHTELRGVYLKKTGKWTMHDYTADEYLSDMIICINMHKLKRKY